MNNQKQSVGIAITINPALLAWKQDLAEQATHAFFQILQQGIDPEGKLDLGGFSSVHHEDRYDNVLWHAKQIVTDYETDAQEYVVAHDIYLCYPNARPTKIKAGTQVERQQDGTFTTISTTGATPHTIPSDAVKRAE